MMAEFRAQFRAIIFAITGIIVAFLIFRVATDLISAPASNPLVGFIDTVTNILIYPFNGIINVPAGILSVLNFNALIAMTAYILGAILFTEIVASFLHDNLGDIIKGLVDIIFKFVEFTLIMRIIFELFVIADTPTAASFVHAMYALTGWSQGLLFRIQFGAGFVDLSAIIALIIVALLDALIDSALSSVFKQVENAQQQVQRKVTTTTTVQQAPPPPPTTHHIVVNVPMPPPQPAQQVRIQPVIIPVPVQQQPAQPLPPPAQPQQPQATPAARRYINSRPIKPKNNNQEG